MIKDPDSPADTGRVEIKWDIMAHIEGINADVKHKWQAIHGWHLGTRARDPWERTAPARGCRLLGPVSRLLGKVKCHNSHVVQSTIQTPPSRVKQKYSRQLLIDQRKQSFPESQAGLTIWPIWDFPAWPMGMAVGKTHHRGPPPPLRSATFVVGDRKVQDQFFILVQPYQQSLHKSSFMQDRFTPPRESEGGWPQGPSSSYGWKYIPKVLFCQGICSYTPVWTPQNK